MSRENSENERKIDHLNQLFYAHRARIFNKFSYLFIFVALIK